MPTAKKQPAPQPGTTISNTVVSMTGAPANEHTAAAVVSLAEALEETARSCGELARAIGRSGGVFNGHGIYVDSPK